MAWIYPLQRWWLLLLCGLLSIAEVSSFINQPGAEPKFSFLQEPAEHAIVSKKFPAVLHCSEKLSDSVQDDLRYSFDGHRTALGGHGDAGGDPPDNEDDQTADVQEPVDDPGNYDDYHPIGARVPSQSTARQQQRTYFNALKADDDPVGVPEHPLRFLPSGMEQFRDSPTKVFSRQRHQRMRRKKRRRRRRHLMSRPTFEYSWTRNGAPLELEATEAFELDMDGTLRILYSEQAAGIYRCVINGTRWGFGALISKESNVTMAEFTRSNGATNVTAEIGNPLVLNCPIYSAPAANVTWSFNDSTIEFGSSTGYYRMANGSLLIAKVTGYNDGKFKCVAVNNFLPKSQRVFRQQVNVIPHQNLATLQRQTGRLMGPFQAAKISIKERSALYLLCVAYKGLDATAAAVRWSFTPRASEIPIALEGFGNELRFGQVLHDQHDGTYSCSVKSDQQSFDVSILVPPTITKELSSITTTMAATIKMGCAASGHPLPQIEWYRNGALILSNSVTVFEGGQLRIHSVDPTDEGIYQCLARNEVGQVFSTAFLTVRSGGAVQEHPPRLYGTKCYPINYESVLVTFRATEPVDMITYYLKGTSWEAVPPIKASQKFIISGRMDPLREYTLHLRGLTRALTEPGQPHPPSKKQESMLTMSRLSKGIQCQTQGLEVLSTAFPDDVFLWWSKVNSHNQRKSNYSVELDYYLVQLISFGSTAHLPSEMLGATAALDEYKTWDEIQGMLVKIPFRATLINSTYVVGTPETFALSQLDAAKTLQPVTRVHYNVTEFRVAGNVTGLLIPNTKRVLVRVIGVKSGEVVADADLKYVQWKSIENSENGVSKLHIVNTHSKNVQLAWNAFGKKKSTCLMLCYKNTNADFLMRGSLADCKTINANKSSVVLKPLPPNTLYKMYLRTCSSAEPITEIIDILTRPDVPGKVTNARLTADDGIVLHWEAPTTQPGIFVQFYAVEWETQGGRVGSANVTADNCQMKLPGITAEDKFSVSIRAVGNTGIGIPHFFNLANLATMHRSKYTDTILAVAIGSLLCVLFICVCVTIIYCHRRRAKARRRQRQMERQVHDQQQQRGNQQMMNGTDYLGLNNVVGDSYHFGGDEDLDNGGISAYDEANTVLPSASDPLTFMQPSIVREEILAGSVPTIIHRQQYLPIDQQLREVHEMQNLMRRDADDHLQTVPNMTLRSDGSVESISFPSGSRRGSSLETDEGVRADGSFSSADNVSGLITSTPTKLGNGMGVGQIQLPVVDVYGSKGPQCLTNNNNPALVNKNVLRGNTLKVQLGSNGPPMRSGIEGRNRYRHEGGERDNFRRQNGRLVLENGYREDDESTAGLLLNGSDVSGVYLDNENTAGEEPGEAIRSDLATQPLWKSFRRPIVGPNG